MKKLLSVLLIILVVAGSSCMASDLITYIKKPDNSFKWQAAYSCEGNDCSHCMLNMTSQTWQGIPWTHDIEVFHPNKCVYPDTAFLLITGGKPDNGMESHIAEQIASRIGCTVAILYQIPNQPLFNGLTEDDLIAYTFTKALETGDTDWPLLLPMAKSAVRAMDVLQAFSKSQFGHQIQGLIVSGASKRGWTTWLTAAADPVRVKGIAPMVYDNLDLPAQMHQQVEYFGKYSEKISSYTNRDIQNALATASGQGLAQIVDPWAYRSRITMPKLIINGANDPYWTVDSLNLYWDSLIGRKSVIYFPNGGHDLGMRTDVGNIARLVSGLTAFTRSIASGSAFPELKWKYQTGKGAERLTVTSKSSIATAVLWTAKSDTFCFTQSHWEASPMEKTTSGYTAKVSAPQNGYLAMFAEVSLVEGGISCPLSTQVKLIKAK